MQRWKNNEDVRERKKSWADAKHKVRKAERDKQGKYSGFLGQRVCIIV